MTEKDLTEYLKKNFPHTSSFISGFALFVVDSLVLLFSIGLGFFIVNLFNTSAINFKSFLNYSAFIPFILIIFACTGLYPGIMVSPPEEVKRFFFSTFFSFMGICFSVFISQNHSNGLRNFFIKDSEYIAIIVSFIIAFPLAFILLPGFRNIFKYIFGNFKWWGVPAVIYCNGEDNYFVIDKLIKHKSLGYHPALIIDSKVTEQTSYKGIPVFPSTENILPIIKNHNVKQAIICDYKGDMMQIMTSYRYTITVSKNQTYFTSNQQLKDIAGTIGFSSIHNLTFKSNYIIKRIVDIGIILILSPIWIPVMIILAILTKSTSKGPVFYGHKRIGKNHKEIKCWKFRSMCVNSQEILQQILETDPIKRAEWEKDRKFQDDPRVTKFGKFLRKTSLDELPQIFNILKGDMSLVGPRPVTEPELVKYGNYKDYVLSVLPGLSGMWQISGRSDTGYEERISFDTYYIQNWSIWLDIWILLKTIWVVLRGKGAY